MRGYEKLAHFMSRKDEYAVFRRFKTLNALNLLYLQAELSELEYDLEGLSKKNASEREDSLKNWWTISHSEIGEDVDQWNQVLKIRDKLKQYNSAMIEQARLSKLSSPQAYDLALFRLWLRRPKMGNHPLLGIDQDVYSDKNEADLVVFKSRSTPSIFLRWFTYKIIPWWHEVAGKRLKDAIEDGIDQDVYFYDNSLLSRTIRVITVVLASLLPVCSVVALYFIQSNALRLVAVVAASGIFSFALALTTNAGLVDVFTATSAYAAVNVVFLTNNVVNNATSD